VILPKLLATSDAVAVFVNVIPPLELMLPSTVNMLNLSPVESAAFDAVAVPPTTTPPVKALKVLLPPASMLT